MTVRVNQFCSSTIPVINHKDDDLSQSQEELTEVRDSVISVVHSREVYDIHSINDTLQVVQEGNCGPLHSCGPNWNLERNSSCPQIHIMNVMMYKLKTSRPHRNGPCRLDEHRLVNKIYFRYCISISNSCFPITYAHIIIKLHF